MFGIGSMMPLPGWRPKPTVADVAREFIAYYTGPVRHPSGGCGNCGGTRHSSTCFVARFIAALDEGATDPARVQSDESAQESGSATTSSSSPLPRATEPEAEPSGREISERLIANAAARRASSPPPHARHLCSGCHHRWEGLTGAELCGDCWRKAQSIVLAPASTLPGPLVDEHAEDHLLRGAINP